MTKRFVEKIRRVWRSEGFNIVDVKVKPVDDKHIEWRIIVEVIEG